ncbi:MAG: rod shape-determining protein RodA [Candidatus Eiseniibacteriota bacterium]|nr:MAG: rod shape-determining protein RodA [Candidatus Eisenbacteria bacterium]
MRLSDIEKRVDLSLIACALILSGIGVALIYSTGQGPLAASRVGLYFKQLTWLGVGLGALSVAAALPLRIYDGFAKILYLMAIVLLVAVLVVGETRYGARRWLDLGGFLFQPSEFAKIAVILFLGRILSNRRTDWTTFRSLMLPVAVTLIPLALIFKEPDLGTGFSLVAILFGMLYWAGVPALNLAVLVLPVVSMLCSFWGWVWLIFFGAQWLILHRSRLSVVHYVFVMIGNGALGTATNKVWNSLEEYQKERIISFLSSGVDRMGAGYQAVQSKIAIGSGNVIGKGFLNGTQKSLAFLPQQHTDFIFAVLGEEFGFIGCCVVVFLYAVIVWKGISIAARARSRFGGLVCAGVVSMLLYHAGVNMLMTLGLAPVTGLPLPFLSYGGSALIVSLAVVGAMAGIAGRLHEY